MPDALPAPFMSAIQPGAYSFLDASALADVGQARRGAVVAVLGAAAGGEPNKPLFFYGEQALKTLLRSGAGYDVARLAFRSGSQPVCFVRIGTGIAQATVTLKDSTDPSPVDSLTLTARDYGAWTNDIKYAVAADNVLTITYTDALGTTYREVFDGGADGGAASFQAIADQINGRVASVAKSSFVSATVADTPGDADLALATATNLAGGADGTVSAGDWTTGLTALEVADVDIIVPATDDATVHAQVTTHCIAMSTPLARKERVGHYGGALGEDVSATVARAAAAGIANRRSQLVYPGVQMLDNDGALTTYEGMYAAAVIAGLRCAQPDAATSLTHVLLPVLGVEVELSTIQGGDLDQLLAAGVSPIAPAPGGGVWLVDDLSLEPTDPMFRDVIKVRAVDQAARRLRNRLERAFVGKKALNATAGSMALEAGAELEALKAEGIIRDYQTPVVEEDPNTPPQGGRRFNVTTPIVPVDTTKFIALTVALQPASTLTGGAATDETF